MNLSNFFIQGFLYIWDIEIYALNNNNIDWQEMKTNKPNCIKSWRAHDSTIISIEYIPESNDIYNGELILTASTDKCCRLWSIGGDYIGVFGQELKWSLRKTYTFQGAINQRNKTLVNMNKTKSGKNPDNDKKIGKVRFKLT